jgi:hypothetical protein
MMGWISTQAFQSRHALLHSQHMQLLQRVQWRRLAHFSLLPQHPAMCLLQPVATTTPSQIALAPRALVLLAAAPIAPVALLVRPAAQQRLRRPRSTPLHRAPTLRQVRMPQLPLLLLLAPRAQRWILPLLLILAQSSPAAELPHLQALQYHQRQLWWSPMTHSQQMHRVWKPCCPACLLFPHLQALHHHQQQLWWSPMSYNQQMHRVWKSCCPACHLFPLPTHQPQAWLPPSAPYPPLPSQSVTYCLQAPHCPLSLPSTLQRVKDPHHHLSTQHCPDWTTPSPP